MQPQAKRKHRKKKPRLPKGYDPSKPGGGLPPPDPERWLPKWQRSDYKKKASARRRRCVWEHVVSLLPERVSAGH